MHSTSLFSILLALWTSDLIAQAPVLHATTVILASAGYSLCYAHLYVIIPSIALVAATAVFLPTTMRILVADIASFSLFACCAHNLSINLIYVIPIFALDALSIVLFRESPFPLVQIVTIALATPALLFASINQSTQIKAYIDHSQIVQVFQASQKFVPLLELAREQQSNVQYQTKDQDSLQDSNIPGQEAPQESNTPVDEVLQEGNFADQTDIKEDWIIIKEDDLQTVQQPSPSPTAKAIELVAGVNAISEARKRLANGGLFVKHGRIGSPRTRKVKLNCTLCRFEWWTEDMSKLIDYVNANELFAVAKGRKTTGFLKADSKNPKEHLVGISFTLLFASRNLDLEAPNASTRDQWVEDANLIISNDKTFFQSRSH